MMACKACRHLNNAAFNGHVQSKTNLCKLPTILCETQQNAHSCELYPLEIRPIANHHHDIGCNVVRQRRIWNVFRTHKRKCLTWWGGIKANASNVYFNLAVWWSFVSFAPY